MWFSEAVRDYILKTQCPHCLTYFNVKPEYIGKKAKCKKCAQGFIMYEAKTALAAPTAEPAGNAVMPGQPGKAKTASARPPAVASAAPVGAAARRTAYPSPPATGLGQVPAEEQPVFVQSVPAESSTLVLRRTLADLPASSTESETQSPFNLEIKMPDPVLPEITAFPVFSSLPAEHQQLSEVPPRARPDFLRDADLPSPVFNDAGAEKGESRPGTGSGSAVELEDQDESFREIQQRASFFTSSEAIEAAPLPANPMLEVPATIIPPRPLSNLQVSPSAPQMMPPASEPEALKKVPASDSGID